MIWRGSVELQHWVAAQGGPAALAETIQRFF
jgi:hypothetical protein